MPSKTSKTHPSSRLKVPPFPTRAPSLRSRYFDAAGMLLTEFFHQFEHHPSNVHLPSHSQGDIAVQVRHMNAQFPRPIRIAAIWHPYPVQSHGSFLRARRKWLSSASLPQRKANPTELAESAAGETRWRTRGFPHEFWRAGGEASCRQDSAPRAPSRGHPGSRPAAALGGHGAARSARPQPSGPRLADRGGLHLPACRPHPGPGEAVRGLHGPPPNPRFPSPCRARPLTARFLRSRPRLEQQQARSGGSPGSGGGVGSPPQPAKRCVLARATNGVQPSRPLASPSALHPSLPAPSVRDQLPPPGPAEPPSAGPAASPLPRRPPPPLSGPRPRELPGWGGGARGAEASRAGEAGAPAAAAISAPPSRCPFMEMKHPA